MKVSKYLSWVNFKVSYLYAIHWPDFQKVFVLCAISFIFFTSKAQADACLLKMRRGTFVYQTTKGTEVKLVRKKRKQKEISNGGKSILITKIIWLNDSTYILVFKRAKNDVGCLKKGTRITNTIIKCSEKEYTCKSFSIDCGETESTITKIE